LWIAVPPGAGVAARAIPRPRPAIAPPDARALAGLVAVASDAVVAFVAARRRSLVWKVALAVPALALPAFLVVVIFVTLLAGRSVRVQLEHARSILAEMSPAWFWIAPPKNPVYVEV
jgi:hypothetical protein